MRGPSAGGRHQRGRRLHVHGERDGDRGSPPHPAGDGVFADGAFGNVRRIQDEQYGRRLIAWDLANPDFVRFAESFGASAERAEDRPRFAPPCAAALRTATARR